jgi:hypothetical protein
MLAIWNHILYIYIYMLMSGKLLSNDNILQKKITTISKEIILNTQTQLII